MRGRPRGSEVARGQSLVEFALILPLLLLLTLVALDFGRVYLGWVNLQNMARIAANFAANNPEAWLPGDHAATISQYEHQIVADASATNCTLSPTTPDSPVFTDMNGDGVTTGLGDHATVTLTCRFAVITPVIASIVGGSVAVTASAVFPVKSGLSGDMGGIEWSCLAPTAAINANPPDGPAPLTVQFTDASGGGISDSWAWDFDDDTTSNVRDPGDHVYAEPGTYRVTFTVGNVCGESTTETTVTVGSTSATPALCVVPNYVQNNVRVRDAPPLWTAAGFTTTIVEGPGHPQGNFRITFQSLTAGTSVDCGATIVVNG